MLAYNTAALTTIGINAPRKFPKNETEIFPGVFDMPGTKGVPVSDWKRSKEQMEEYARLRKGKVIK